MAGFALLRTNGSRRHVDEFTKIAGLDSFTAGRMVFPTGLLGVCREAYYNAGTASTIRECPLTSSPFFGSRRFAPFCRPLLGELFLLIQVKGLRAKPAAKPSRPRRLGSRTAMAIQMLARLRRAGECPFSPGSPFRPTTCETLAPGPPATFLRSPAPVSRDSQPPQRGRESGTPLPAILASSLRSGFRSRCATHPPTRRIFNGRRRGLCVAPGVFWKFDLHKPACIL